MPQAGTQRALPPGQGGPMFALGRSTSRRTPDPRRALARRMTGRGAIPDPTAISRMWRGAPIAAAPSRLGALFSTD